MPSLQRAWLEGIGSATWRPIVQLWLDAYGMFLSSVDLTSGAAIEAVLALRHYAADHYFAGIWRAMNSSHYRFHGATSSILLETFRSQQLIPRRAASDMVLLNRLAGIEKEKKDVEAAKKRAKKEGKKLPRASPGEGPIKFLSDAEDAHATHQKTLAYLEEEEQDMKLAQSLHDAFVLLARPLSTGMVLFEGQRGRKRVHDHIAKLCAGIEVAVDAELKDAKHKACNERQERLYDQAEKLDRTAARDILRKGDEENKKLEDAEEKLIPARRQEMLNARRGEALKKLVGISMSMHRCVSTSLHPNVALTFVDRDRTLVVYTVTDPALLGIPLEFLFNAALGEQELLVQGGTVAKITSVEIRELDGVALRRPAVQTGTHFVTIVHASLSRL